MRFSHLALAAAGLLASAPLYAQSPEKPVLQKDASVGDVALTPVSDLGLKKNEIPSLLLSAQENPYELGGLRKCPQIASAVGELDAVLGDDYDVADGSAGKIMPGRVAQAAVGALIPFRGLIREISGANAHDRNFQAAVNAGIARRAFLKGVGQARGCGYPARPATLAVLQARDAQAAATRVADAKPSKPVKGKNGMTYVANPVVQKPRR